MEAGGRSKKTPVRNAKAAASPKKKAGKGQTMKEKRSECDAAGGTFFPNEKAGAYKGKDHYGLCVSDCSNTNNNRFKKLCQEVDAEIKKPRRAVKAAAKGKGGKKASAPRKAASAKTGVAEKEARAQAAEQAEKAYHEAKLAGQRASAEAKKQAKEEEKAARKAMMEARKEAKKPAKSLPGKGYTAAELKKEVAKVETDSDLFRKLDALRENGAKEDLQRHDSALRHLIQTARRKLSGGRRRKSSSEGRKRSSRGRAACKKKGYVRRRTPRAKPGCVKRSTAQKQAAAYRKRKKKSSGKRRR